MRAIALALAALLLCAASLSAQTAPIVIKARTVIDGKTMTIEQRSTDDKGRPVVNVELFERQ